MPNIDEQVVKMTFDNHQFEKGVSQSLKTIQDLKKALELDKMGDSLRGLETVSNTINSTLSDMSRSAEKVANVFTPFGRLVENTLDRISNKVIDVTKNFATLVTGMQGLDAGMAKYEAYTRSVQTITNATGKSVKDVSKVLDVLMKYTDETSYDFSEMVKSIGKFTSVGIDLERAEAAMEGIANWAAKSGAQKAEANRAMYNISQAMGAGYMKLIDWKSIENANMATKEFKEVAIATAEDLGVIAKNSGITYQNFNETLKDGWLTAEVMTRVLEKYADTSTEFGLAAFHAAQEALTFTDAIEALKDAISSGWMKSLEYIFGDLDEARVMWTNVANALIEFSDIFSSTRNELLQGWHELGGYNVMVEAASNIWQTFMNIVLGVKEAMENVFPPATAENLLAITNRVKGFSDQLLQTFGIDTYTEVTETFDAVINKAEELNQTLKKGDKNDYTKVLQNQLIKGGYLDKGQADGIFGPKTEEAVKKLQKTLGVDVTGAWDDATRKAAVANKVFTEKVKKERTVTKKNVEEVVEKYKETVNYAKKLNQNLKKGTKNDYVKLLQKRLIKMGLLSDKAGADGIYGPKTEEAVKKLQKELGVNVTGVWDDATRAAASTSKAFNEVIEKERTVYKETEGLTPAMERIQNIVRGIGHAIRIAWNIIKGGFNLAKNVLKMFDPVIEVLGRLTSMFSSMFTNLSEGLEDANTFNSWVNSITSFLQPVADLLEYAAASLDMFITSYARFLKRYDLQNTFGNFFLFLVNYIKQHTILGPIITFAERFIGLLLKLKDKVFQVIGDIVAWVTEKLGGLFQKGGITKAIQESVQNNGLIAALLRIYVSVRAIVLSIAQFVSDTFSSLFGQTNAEQDAKKSGVAKVFESIGVVITAAANALSIALALIAQGVMFLIDILGPVLVPALILVGQVIANMSRSMAKGEITSLPGFFIALGKSFAQTEIGSKIIGTVGGKISAFLEILRKFIEQHFPGLLGVLKTKWEQFKAFFTFDSSKTFIENIREKLNQVKEWFINTLTSIKDYVSKNFPRIVSFLKNTWSTIRQLFSYDFTKTFAENIKSKFDIIKNYISYIISQIMGLLKQLGESIRVAFTPDANGKIPIFETLKSKLQVFEPVVNWFIALKDKIVGAWQEITGLGKNDGGAAAGKGFTSVLDKVKQFLSSASKMGFEKIIIPAFAALAGFQLFKGAKAIGNISKSLDEGGLMAVLKGRGGKDEDGIADKIMKIAGSVVAISLAVGLLSIIDANKAQAGVNLFIEMLGALFVAMLAVDKFNLNKVDIGKPIHEMGKGLLSIAKAIALMFIILGIANLNEKNQALLKDSIIILGVTLVTLAGLQIAINKFGKDANGKKVNGILEMCKGVEAIAIALAITMAAIKWLGGNNSEWKAFAMIEVILATLGGIMWLVTSKSKGSQKKINVKGFLSMCAGVLLIAFAYAKVLNSIKEAGSPEDASKAFWMIEGILATLGAIIVLLSTFGKGGKDGLGVAAQFVAMAAMLWVAFSSFGHAINSIKDANPEVITAFADGFLKVFGVLAAAVAVFSKIGFEVLIGDLGIAGLFAAIAAGVYVLGSVAISLVDNATYTLRYIGNRLAYFSNSIKDVDWDLLNKAAGWLETVPEMFISALSGQLNNAKAAADTMNEIWTIGINLKHYSDEIAGIGTELLSKSLIAIAGVKLAKVIADTINSISIGDNVEDGKLSLLGAHLNIYTTELADITENDKSDIALSMVQKASDIASGIAAITFDDSTAKSLLTVSSALNLYYRAMNNIGKVDENGNALDSKSMFDISDVTIDADTIQSVLEGVAAAIPKETVQQLQNYKEGGQLDMTEVALGIEALGTALESYGEHIGTLETQKVTDANNVIDAVKGLDQYLKDSNIDSASGYLTDNSSSISAFSGHIVTLGVAIGKYGFFVGKVKKDSVENANSVIEAFMKLNTHLTDDQGNRVPLFLGGLFGEKESIEQFGTHIQKVGENIGSYANSIGTLDADKVTVANNLMDHLAKVSNDLPKIGGWVQTVEGSQDLGRASEALKILGEEMISFQNAINPENGTKLDIDKVKVGFEFMEEVAGLGKYFTEVGKYNENTNQMMTDIEVVTQAVVNSIKTLSQLTMANPDGSGSTASLLESFANIGKALTDQVSTGITSEETEKQVISKAIETAINTAKESVKTTFIDIGKNGTDSIGTGITTKETETNSIMTAMANVVNNAYTAGKTTIESYFKQIGRDGDAKIAEGLTDEETTNNHIANAAELTIGNVIVTIRDFYDEFVSAGQYLNLGLIEGALAGRPDVVETFRQLAQATIKVYEKETEVNSPSRKFMWIAQMCALGLKNGFDKYGYLVTDSTMSMANSSLSAITAAFDQTKLDQVGQGALDTIKKLLIGGDTTGKQKGDVVKQILVMSGYLKDVNADTAEVKKAIILFKKEVLGMEGVVDATWKYKDSVSLFNVAYRKLHEGGSTKFDKLQYEAEMMDNLNGKYEKTATTMDTLLSKYGKFNKTLGKGSKGQDVKDLQEYLNTLSSTKEKLTIDGVFGNKTADAVKAAQKEARLKETGIWDEKINTAILAKREKQIEAKKAKREKQIEAEKAKKAKKKNKYEVGNVDLDDRKIISPEEMRKAGWKEFDGDYATLFSSTFTAGDKTKGYDYQSDKNMVIDVTPILPNGEVLSPTGLEDYVGKIIASGDVLNADKTENGGLGLVLKVSDVKDGNLDKAIEASEKWTKELHDSQASIYNKMYNIDTMQKLLVETGYLRSGSFKPGKENTATKVATEAFMDEVMHVKGVDRIGDSWMKQINKNIEKYGSISKLMLARTGTTKKPEEYLEEADKKIQKKIEKQEEYKQQVSDMQSILEGLGLLKANSYTVGKRDEVTRKAIKKWQTNYLGRNKAVADDKVYTKDLEKWDKMVEAVNGDYDKLQEKYGDKETRKVIADNEKYYKKLKSEMDIYGYDNMYDMGVSKKYALGRTDKKVFGVQKMLEKYGYLAAGSYKEGKSEKTTMDALMAFKDAYFGGKHGYSGGATATFNTKELKQLEKDMEDYGDLDHAIKRKLQGKKPKQQGYVEEEWMRNKFWGDNEINDVFLSAAGVGEGNEVFSGMQNAWNGIMSQMDEATASMTEQLGGENSIVSNLTDTMTGFIDTATGEILGDYKNIGEMFMGQLFGDGTASNDLITGFANYFGIDPKDVESLVNGDAVGNVVGNVLGNSTVNAFFENLKNGIKNGDYSALKECIPEDLRKLWPEASSSGATVKKTAKLNMTNTASALKDNISYSKTSGKTLNYSGNSTNSTTRPVLTSEAVYKPFKTPVTTAATSLTQVKRISSTIQLEVSRVRTAIVNSNNNLNRQFTNLNNHLSRIDSDIKNMKLYLDGNKLVGGIITRVDSSLGRRQSISRRTN